MTNMPDKIYIADEGIEYIRADLVPQWQPIETAPMDGTRILLCRPNHIIPVCEGWYENNYIKSFHWRCYDGGVYKGPIYWMPLPQPPMED